MRLNSSLAVLIAALAISTLTSGCWNTKDDHEITVFYIVDRTVTDSLGNTLEMSFDNNAGTARILFNNDTITMTQDTTGSGISYSNSEYKFNEWRKIITLYKNGEIIFETNK